MLTYLKKKLHHYFLPHESNNYRARTLHNSAVIFYIILLVFFQFSVSIIKHVRPNILGYATDISVAKILNLVNQRRIEANLPPLSLSSQLSVAATQKANDMFGKNYWAHISPTGTTPWLFINSAGYEYVYAGENLARNFNTADEVVEAWMNSSTHRANILKPEYKDIGLAVLNGKLNGEETTLVVQEFGTSAKTAAAEIIPTGIPQQPIVQKQAELTDLPTVRQQPLGIDNTVSNKSKISIAPFFFPAFSKTFSLAIAEFLLVVLFVDSIYLWKFKTPRLSSHSLAHIIFLGALIGAMGATGFGVIL